MANNLKSWVTIKANEDTLKFITPLIERARKTNKNDSYGIIAFASAFYKNIDSYIEGEGIKSKWSYNNIGSKWTYLEDIIGDGEFSIMSANYPPKEFLIHLYKLCAELDENVVIEVLYEDESYNPIGAMVIKKDKFGPPCIWEEEDYIINPFDDIDCDEMDTNHDEMYMEFSEQLHERKEELLKECHKLVLVDGVPI